VQIRQNRGLALQKADVVILAGTVCDFRLSYGRGLSKKSKIITVNRSKEEMLLNSKYFWSPALASNSDPCSFLLELSKGADKKVLSEKYTPWLAELRKAQDKTEAKNIKKKEEKAVGHGSAKGVQLINPLHLFMELEICCPKTAS